MLSGSFLKIATRFVPKRAYAAAAAAATSAPAHSEGQLLLTFSSPNTAYYSNKLVKQVDVPTQAGVVGILASHVPTIGVLKPGVVSVFDEDGNVQKLFVSSGTLSVNIDGTVKVLAEEIIKVEDIDESAANRELQEGQRKAVESTSDVDKAEAAIQVEVAEALLKAVSGHQ